MRPRIVSYGSPYSYYVVQDLVFTGCPKMSIQLNLIMMLIFLDRAGAAFQLPTDQVRKFCHEVVFCCWLQSSGHIPSGSLAFSSPFVKQLPRSLLSDQKKDVWDAVAAIGVVQQNRQSVDFSLFWQQFSLVLLFAVIKCEAWHLKDGRDLVAASSGVMNSHALQSQVGDVE